MSYFSSEAHKKTVTRIGHVSSLLLTEENGCENGCMCGISRYFCTEYPAPSTHDDQEGFYVLSGKGKAMIAEEEAAIAPGSAFIVPAGKPHSLCSISSDCPVTVFWFHAAI